MRSLCMQLSCSLLTVLQGPRSLRKLMQAPCVRAAHAGRFLQHANTLPCACNDLNHCPVQLALAEHWSILLVCPAPRVMVQTQQLWVSEMSAAIGRSSYGTSSPALQVQLPEHLVGACSLGQVVHITGHASCAAGPSSIPCIQVCCSTWERTQHTHSMLAQRSGYPLSLQPGVVLPTAVNYCRSARHMMLSSCPCSSSSSNVHATHGHH